MLPKKFRLSQKKDFNTVFTEGRSRALCYFFVRYTENRLGYPRIGIIVSNKVSKKAIERNKVKRRIREIVWNIHSTLGSADIIIIAKQGSVNIRYSDIQKDIGNIPHFIMK